MIAPITVAYGLCSIVLHEPIDPVDLIVVLTGSITTEVIMMVSALIPPFPPFSVIIAMGIAIVESPMVVMVVVSFKGVVGLLASSDIFFH